VSHLDDFLHFAVDLAREAGRLTLGYYQSGVEVAQKADRSPVTIADRDAELLIRSRIADRFPDHAMVGEEFGDDGRSSATHRWFIDPIDGTRSFIHGVPLYAVLIGLEIAGSLSVGVAHFPALGETLAAATGLGCRWNGQPAHVSSTARLSEACVAYTDARQLHARLGDRWLAIQRGTKLQRGWGDAYGHCLVATGRADVALDPHMNPWDCAALVPILEEAGGTFTDWAGATTIHGGDAVSTNGVLSGQVLAAVRP